MRPRQSGAAGHISRGLPRGVRQRRQRTGWCVQRAPGGVSSVCAGRLPGRGRRRGAGQAMATGEGGTGEEEQAAAHPGPHQDTGDAERRASRARRSAPGGGRLGEQGLPPRRTFCGDGPHVPSRGGGLRRARASTSHGGRHAGRIADGFLQGRRGKHQARPPDEGAAGHTGRL